VAKQKKLHDDDEYDAAATRQLLRHVLTLQRVHFAGDEEWQKFKSSASLVIGNER
jgi:hypothetical protein